MQKPRFRVLTGTPTFIGRVQNTVREAYSLDCREGSTLISSWPTDPAPQKVSKSWHCHLCCPSLPSAMCWLGLAPGTASTCSPFSFLPFPPIHPYSVPRGIFLKNRCNSSLFSSKRANGFQFWGVPTNWSTWPSRPLALRSQGNFLVPSLIHATLDLDLFGAAFPVLIPSLWFRSITSSYRPYSSLSAVISYSSLPFSHLLQPPWLPCHSYHVPTSFPPQGLCLSFFPGRGFLPHSF